MGLLLFALTSCNSSETSQQTTAPSPCVSHTPEKGKCSVCGIDFYNELLNLLENSTYGDRTKAYGTQIKNYTRIDEYIVLYAQNEDCIMITCNAYNGEQNHSLYIRKGGLITGIYEWRISNYSIDGYESYSGTIDPLFLPSSTSMQLTDYHGCSESTAKRLMNAVYIDKAIKYALIPLLATSQRNLTPADYGFVNY